MTDDLKKTSEQQSQNTQAQTNPVDKNQAKTFTSNASNSAAKPDSNVTRPAEPQVKKVDIAIAGITYPIYCPVHEEEELRAAVFYINDYVLDLRRNSPSLSQESLLVLCCLNLYEKIQTNKRDEEDRLQQNKQSEALLNKVIKDAHSIL